MQPKEIKEEAEEDEDLPVIKQFSFISNPMTNLMSKDRFEQMLKDADRTNETAKINYFVGVFKNFVAEVDFYKKFVEKSDFLKNVIDFDYIWVERFTYFISLIINLLLIISLNDTNFIDPVYTFKDQVEYDVLTALAAIQIGINAIAIVIYLTSKQVQLTYIKKKRKEDAESRGEVFDDGYSITPTLAISLLNIIIAAIGLVDIKTCWVFTIQLLFIVRFSETCQQIADVFRDKFGSLVTMIAFLAIICFMYAFIAFYFLETEFWSADIQDNQCVNMISCVVTAFNHPVRNGNGIGIVEPKHPFYNNVGLSMGRFFFDISYWTIINILLLNMVNGVIISSFGSKREEDDARDSDRKNKCFMCSVDTKSFQKLRVNYVTHIKTAHNVKHYIEFLMGIMIKETADLEDDEIYIKEQIIEGGIKVFPLGCFIGPEGKAVKPEEED